MGEIIYQYTDGIIEMENEDQELKKECQRGEAENVIEAALWTLSEDLGFLGAPRQLMTRIDFVFNTI
jgi:hypothetical protein